MWGPWHNEVLVFRRDVNKGDYAYGKGYTGDSCNTPTSEKRATGEGEGREEEDGVKEGRVTIEDGGESRVETIGAGQRRNTQGAPVR